MAENKMTQVEMYAAIADRCSDCEEIVEFCGKKIEQLEKRKNAPRKPRFNAQANEFAARLVEEMRKLDEPATNKELVAAMLATGHYETVSAQKVAAALRRIEKGEVYSGDDFDSDPVEVTLEIHDDGKVKTYALA